MERPNSGPKPSAAPSPESRIGTLIQGEYQVERLIGEHELGPLYEADNARRKGRFLLLMLRREISPSLKAMLAVRNDLRRASELSALGLFPIEQVADMGGVAGFATEMLPGETLQALIGRGPMPVDRALLLVGMLAQTLAAAHGKGLLHGDLRPDNVLLIHPEARKPFGGRAMLLGHTLYRLFPRPGARSPVARLRYCPPEQVSGAAADVRRDVFALGALLYECVAGAPAFAPGVDDPQTVLTRLAEGPPPPLQQNLATGLSPEAARVLDVVIAGACNPDPRVRLGDMSEFARALRQVAQGAGLKWPEEGLPRREVSLVRVLGNLLDPPQRRRPVPSDDRPRPAPAAAPQSVPNESIGGMEEDDQPTLASTPDELGVPPEAASDEVTPTSGKKEPIASGKAPLSGRPAPLSERAARSSGDVSPISRKAESAGAGSAPAASTRSPVRPPPLPKAMQGRSDEKTRLLTKEIWQRETTLPQARPGRSMRASDITQLVAAVQEGRIDPQEAVSQAHQGLAMGLSGRLLITLLEYPRITLFAGAVLSLLLLFLVILRLSRC